jgi:hypothetical protein
MGNGFTFPLESLIFWAITCVACGTKARDSVTVFGDDIICPASYIDDVTKALELCGFSVNLKKSYWDGPFRESCGCDYFNGINIRPFYQKHLVSGQTLFVLHNYYVRWGQDDLANKVRQHIPKPLRLYGPDGYGDGHLVARQWAGKLSRKLGKAGYAGLFFETLVLNPRSMVSIYPGDWVSPLYSVYTKGRESLLELNWETFGRRDEYCELTDSSAVRFTASGRPIWTLPGAEPGDYSKKLIYTFKRPD